MPLEGSMVYIVYIRVPGLDVASEKLGSSVFVYFGSSVSVFP